VVELVEKLISRIFDVDRILGQLSSFPFINVTEDVFLKINLVILVVFS
jgi:hypothetical protein